MIALILFIALLIVISFILFFSSANSNAQQWSTRYVLLPVIIAIVSLIFTLAGFYIGLLLLELYPSICSDSEGLAIISCGVGNMLSAAFLGLLTGLTSSTAIVIRKREQIILFSNRKKWPMIIAGIIILALASYIGYEAHRLNARNNEIRSTEFDIQAGRRQ